MMNDETIKKITLEKKDIPETRMYKITATPSQLFILEELFHTMEQMGRVGASRRITLYVDGDGAFHPQFTYQNDERIPSKLNHKCDIIQVGYGIIKKNSDNEEYPDSIYWKYYDFG